MPTADLNLPLLASAALSAALAIALTKRRALAAPKLAHRDLSPLPVPIWLLGAMLILLAPYVGASFSLALPPSIAGPDKSLQQNAIQQLFAYTAALVVGGVLLALIRRGLFAGPAHLRSPATSPTLSTLGFTIGLADFPRAIFYLLITAPFYILVSESASWLERILRHQPADTIKHTTLKKIVDAFTGSAPGEKPWAWIVIASVVLLVPAIEELLYRGFLQSFFIRTLPNRHPLIPITINSLLFALMHVATDVVPWSAAAALFALSMALGIAFERTGRLGVPILMHAMFNAINVAAALWS